MEAHQYVATLRASFAADDEVQAQLAADNMAEAVRELLDEDTDDVVVTQVIDTEPAIVADEMVNVLARARDTLIKTRMMSYVDLAREIDKVCFALEYGDLQTLVPYDYGRFMERVEQLLRKPDGNTG